MMQEASLGFTERVIFALRALYNKYGYTQYRMSKFEEYDLYARNKDFLISDSVITFTDTNGRLMALKPDVTLSIVKNTKDVPGGVIKLYYNENVYRVSRGANSFREITQVGLECMGDIDDYTVYETLTLAAMSLKEISPRSILDISSLGLLSRVIDISGVPGEIKPRVLKCIGEKNLHELTGVCAEAGVSEEGVGLIKQLVSLSGPAAEMTGRVVQLLDGRVEETELARFRNVMDALCAGGLKDMLNIDFSVVDDVHYYSGFVFKGFVDGVPTAVLSGGEYDKLMQKLGRRSGAIGFAVYMDFLDMLDSARQDFDVDVLVVYDDATSIPALQKWVKAFMDSGSSVLVQRSVPDDIKCRQLMRLKNGEVEILENNA